jgi:hypothetical protein
MKKYIKNKSISLKGKSNTNSANPQLLTTKMFSSKLNQKLPGTESFKLQGFLS